MINPGLTWKLIKRIVSMASAVTLRPAAYVTLKLLSKLIDGRSQLPILQFLLMDPLNTTAIEMLHNLQKTQVATDRRVIVVTRWPFWPVATAKDESFVSFIRGLFPGLNIVWIPAWLQLVIIRCVYLVCRLLLKTEAINRPAGLNSTIRYRPGSIWENVDILNHGERVALQIPKSHELELESRLRSLGVPPGAWFVCVHAREHGYAKVMKPYSHNIPASYRHEQEDHRNVDIRDFFPTIDYIKSMGGMVVRMGDPSMTPIGDIDGVIDYPFTEHWSMPMDLYLISRCRFVLGCNSGFSWCFPHCFNKPVLTTNISCSSNTACFPYSNNIFLFMHAVEKSSGRFISPKEMCHPSLAAINPAMDDAVSFDSLGYRWQQNSPDEILEAVQDMLELTEANAFDDPRTAEQELFHQYRLEILDSLCSNGTVITKYSVIKSSQSRISAPFAARYFGNVEQQTHVGGLA